MERDSEGRRERGTLNRAQTPTSQRVRRRVIGLALVVAGPGLVVMLADTDAGSLITAAQSGSRWGYRMVLPQLILIPVLYIVQEMTVRLGILTHKGHGALIREHFGPRWALLSAGTLFACGVGALLTEFAGVAGVGELFGIPRSLSVPVATAYAFVWVAVLVYVWSIWRRLGKVEHEMHALQQRARRDSR